VQGTSPPSVRPNVMLDACASLPRDIGKSDKASQLGLAAHDVLNGLQRVEYQLRIQYIRGEQVGG